MATDVSICNSALIKIGVSSRIASLDEDSKAAILCKEQFPKLRDEVLEQHDWIFARKRASLAPLGTAPVWGYASAFQLPADCLAVREIEGDPEYQTEGRTIVTDESAIKIRYTAQIVDISKFTPLFCETLALRIAADICYAITQSQQLTQTTVAAYDAQLKRMRSRNSREGTPQEIQVNDFLTARY